MYRKHFGFTRHPFGKEIAPEELFPSCGKPGNRRPPEPPPRTARHRPDHGRERFRQDLRLPQGVDRFAHRPVALVYVALSTGNVMDLYKTIAWEMGLPTERSRAALYRQIRTEVNRLCTEARCRPVLVVDEAHNLRSDVLEDLRLLTNYQMDSENRLCLLLVGQAELRRRLAMAVYEALAQRIVVRYHYAALGRDEMPPYIAHRLSLAGTQLPLFEPAALEAVFQATRDWRARSTICATTRSSPPLWGEKAVTVDHVHAALPEVM